MRKDKSGNWQNVAEYQAVRVDRNGKMVKVLKKIRPLPKAARFIKEGGFFEDLTGKKF